MKKHEYFHVCVKKQLLDPFIDKKKKNAKVAGCTEERIMKSSSFNRRLLITYLTFATTVRRLFHHHTNPSVASAEVAIWYFSIPN